MNDKVARPSDFAITNIAQEKRDALKFVEKAYDYKIFDSCQIKFTFDKDQVYDLINSVGLNNYEKRQLYLMCDFAKRT